MTKKVPGGRVSFVVHAHLYQPPRENPWTGSMPREPSAAPFHDWNARIHDECYGPLTAARILDEGGRVRRFVNTLARVSFDAAPTLLRWLERETPSTYEAILEADRLGVERLGHGNAIATAYHHVILPLSSPRDRRTEIRWGLTDFRRRFGRDPEGFWLPEAAVDRATLQALADEGIAFTIVGSDQVVDGAPADGRAGRVKLDGGRSIAVFAYDGGMAHGVSFGGLLRDADQWAADVGARAPTTGEVVVSLATDGETFGHHHTFGELGLARVLDALSEAPEVRVENYAAALARLGTGREVTIHSPSAWSCAHGVGRWERACGCRAGAEESSQAWRAPLREGLAALAEALGEHFEAALAGAGVGDPWDLRDRFGAVVDAGLDARRGFAAREAPGADPVRLLEWLEAEREALASFTSCAWFFDDVAGLETLNVLRSAARALDLAGPDARSAEEAFRAVLARAESNDPARGDGATLWDEEVRTTPGAPSGAAAVAGFRRYLGAGPRTIRAGAFSVDASDGGEVTVTDLRTGRRHLRSVEVERGEVERGEVASGGAEGEAVEGGGLRLAVARVREMGPGADADATAVPVGPEALPHPWDQEVTALLRSRLLARWLPRATRAALLTGVESLPRAGTAALLRILTEADPSDDQALRDATHFVDWLSSAGGVPPSAQVALAAAARRFGEALAPLLERAGVAPEAS